MRNERESDRMARHFQPQVLVNSWYRAKTDSRWICVGLGAVVLWGRMRSAPTRRVLVDWERE